MLQLLRIMKSPFIVAALFAIALAAPAPGELETRALGSCPCKRVICPLELIAVSGNADSHVELWLTFWVPGMQMQEERSRSVLRGRCGAGHTVCEAGYRKQMFHVSMCRREVWLWWQMVFSMRS